MAAAIDPHPAFRPNPLRAAPNVLMAAGNLLSIQNTTSATISIFGFSPANGLPGTQVTIYGLGFSATPANDTVTFNGVAAVVSSATVQ